MIWSVMYWCNDRPSTNSHLLQAEGEKAFDEVFTDIANTIDTTLFIPNGLFIE